MDLYVGWVGERAGEMVVKAMEDKDDGSWAGLFDRGGTEESDGGVRLWWLVMISVEGDEVLWVSHPSERGIATPVMRVSVISMMFV